MHSYAQQLEDAWDWLNSEAAQFGGRMLPIHVTPYIIGLPHRIDRFERLLRSLADRRGNWFAATDAIVSATMPFLSPAAEA